MVCYKVSMTWDNTRIIAVQKRVTFKKLQTCLKDELDQIIIDSSIGEIIVRDLEIDARCVQNSALRNLCLKPGDVIIQMLAFDMIECSRLIAQNNSNHTYIHTYIRTPALYDFSSIDFR